MKRVILTEINRDDHSNLTEMILMGVSAQLSIKFAYIFVKMLQIKDYDAIQRFKTKNVNKC